MLESINESIAVVVSFDGDKVLPRKFRWRNKEYAITRVTMVHSTTHGRDTIYFFSVTDSVNFFRLAFYTRDLHWVLEELYTE